MCALALIPLASPARTRFLTKDEAQKLVVAALGQRIKDLPHFGLDDVQPREPKEKDFYLFEASFSNPGGMQVAGHYAVHKLTGAVWEFLVCRRLESEELHSLQKTFRKRTGISSNEVKRLADALPCDEPSPN